MKYITSAAIAVISTALYGCCAAIFYPSISVSVFDDATGARLCGFKASATDDMQTFKGENLQADGCDSKDTVIFFNYPGKFSVSVEKPGYTPWKKEIEITQASAQCSGYVEHIKVTLKKI